MLEARWAGYSGQRSFRSTRRGGPVGILTRRSRKVPAAPAAHLNSVTRRGRLWSANQTGYIQVVYEGQATEGPGPELRFRAGPSDSKCPRPESNRSGLRNDFGRTSGPEAHPLRSGKLAGPQTWGAELHVMVPGQWRPETSLSFWKPSETIKNLRFPLKSDPYTR